MSTQVEDLLLSHVERGTMPGGVAVLGLADSEPEIVAVGSAAVDGSPMRSDAIMRIQSMTKAITSVAALRLVADGRLRLDDGLEGWLPELAGRRVLTSPIAALSDTVPASRPITLRHLLTNTSGYGMITVDSPLQRAMVENATDIGVDAASLGGADEWLARLTELPLAFQPGRGWRYHHSFALLGILISRVAGRPTGDHLRDDLLEPLGMVDTAFWAPVDEAHRLPAAYRHTGNELIEMEPAGGGFYADEPPFDVSHGELVSTAADYFGFLRMLVHGGVGQTGAARGERMLPAKLAAAMIRDQTPAIAKHADSFFPGFWDEMGWGFGVGVETTGPHAGRYTWSGGQGTNFYVDPDGMVGILLTQVELGDPIIGLISEFQKVPGRR